MTAPKRRWMRFWPWCLASLAVWVLTKTLPSQMPRPASDEILAITSQVALGMTAFFAAAQLAVTVLKRVFG